AVRVAFRATRWHHSFMQIGSHIDPESHMAPRDDTTRTPPHGDPLREETSEQRAAPPDAPEAPAKSRDARQRTSYAQSGGAGATGERGSSSQPEQREQQHPKKMPAQHQE